jgi:hypothetical protein
MSAFEGKADIGLTPRKCLLLTQSGHGGGLLGRDTVLNPKV